MLEWKNEIRKRLAGLNLRAQLTAKRGVARLERLFAIPRRIGSSCSYRTLFTNARRQLISMTRNRKIKSNPTT